jgi:hypothetical protein|tara:strand:- start:398 stop:556 length:159 start_codon:yes stop_codon:yes gene_type:complete
MEIHSKRGVWYVTEPDHPIKRFDSEEAALAYVKGEDPVMDADIDDEDEYYDE